MERTSKRKPLSNEDLQAMVPAIFASRPHERTSGKYTFMPTIEIVNLMREQGWYPVQAQIQRAQIKSRDGFQKHLLRFQHPDLILKDEAIDAVFINSHDLTSALKAMLGVYRFICSNGMISGETFGQVNLRHIGCTPDQIIGACQTLWNQAPKLAGVIEDWKAIELTPDQRGVYATAAAQLLGTEENPNPLREQALGAYGRDMTLQLVEPVRWADEKNDLWTTFNTVQERMMKGMFSKFNQPGKKARKARAIKNIDRDASLNRALFTLTEKMAELAHVA